MWVILGDFWGISGGFQESGRVGNEYGQYSGESGRVGKEYLPYSLPVFANILVTRIRESKALHHTGQTPYHGRGLLGERDSGSRVPCRFVGFAHLDFST